MTQRRTFAASDPSPAGNSNSTNSFMRLIVNAFLVGSNIVEIRRPSGANGPPHGFETGHLIRRSAGAGRAERIVISGTCAQVEVGA